MTIVYAIAAKIYVFPRIGTVDPKNILIPILLLHATRHLGLMFLSPGATYVGIPPEFTFPAAIGDLIAAILAILSIAIVIRGSSFSRLSLWIFNIWGTMDLLTAITLANFYQVESFMGPAYWIPAFWVPALLVTHFIVFVLLIRRWQGDERRTNAIDEKN